MEGLFWAISKWVAKGVWFMLGGAYDGFMLLIFEAKFAWCLLELIINAQMQHNTFFCPIDVSKVAE